MAGRPPSSSDAKALAKVFRSHFQQMDVNIFAEDFELCLKRHEEFFVDLWKQDKYLAEGKLQACLKIVWPKMDASLGKQIAKSVKSVLSSIHCKKARMPSGQKSLSMQSFVKKIGQEPQLPVMSPKRIAKSMLKAPSTKPAGPSSSTAALYGLAFAGLKDPMSQMTISDADEDIAVSQKTILPDVAITLITTNAAWSKFLLIALAIR